MIYRLACTCGKYFLSRPRRFGKTLLLSAFESLFSTGLKDFKGLAIETLWKEEQTFDVLYLDFSRLAVFAAAEQFKAKLEKRLMVFMLDHPVRESPGMKSPGNDLAAKFDNWLGRRPGRSLVLLIDEYDAPLNACLNKPELFEEVRKVLQEFYSIIKGNAGALRFMFFTGICRYRNTGIFSGFNIYEDLTMDPEYATLLGFTEAEITHYFGVYLQNAARVPELKEEDCLKKLREHYGGFCFDSAAAGAVYAPWSVLNFFKRPAAGFKNYWYGSGGRPELLVCWLKQQGTGGIVEYGEDLSISFAELSSVAAPGHGGAAAGPVALLAQAGYPGIRAVRSDDSGVVLNYPNREIAVSLAVLYRELVFRDAGNSEYMTGEKIRTVFAGKNAAEIVRYLNRLFLNPDYFNYPLTGEAVLRTIVQLCLLTSDFDAGIETHSSRERSALEVFMPGCLLVLEFRFARKPDEEKKFKGMIPKFCLRKPYSSLRSAGTGSSIWAAGNSCVWRWFFQKRRTALWSTGSCN